MRHTCNTCEHYIDGQCYHYEGDIIESSPEGTCGSHTSTIRDQRRDMFAAAALRAYLTVDPYDISDDPMQAIKTTCLTCAVWAESMIDTLDLRQS